LERCLKLISDKKCSQREAEQLFGISRSSIRRAQKAVKDHRDAQVNGRPRTFSLEEQENVVNIVRGEVKAGKSVDYSEMKRIVCL
jgi:transposase